MSGGQSIGQVLDQLLVDKIFDEADVDSAEFVIESIVDILERGQILRGYERLYLVRALKSWIDHPGDAKAAFGIKRNDKKGNFKNVDYKAWCRDHLIFLYSLKYRNQGKVGDELLDALKSTLSRRFSIDQRKVQRAKARLREEYESMRLNDLIIEERIALFENLI